MSVLDEILSFFGLISKQGTITLGQPITYAIGGGSVAVPWPVMDQTVYEVQSGNAAIYLEMIVPQEGAPGLASRIVDRLTGIYGSGSDLSTADLTVAGRQGALVTGSCPNSPASDAALDATSPTQLRIAVAILPPPGFPDPAMTTVTVVSDATDPDPWPDLNTNLANANSGGATASGLTRSTLAGWLLDVPSTYKSPSAYRFGASYSLTIDFVFDASGSTALTPNDIIWFDATTEQLVATPVVTGQAVTLGTLQGSVDQWSVVRQLQSGSTTISTWNLYRLVTAWSATMQLQVLGRASGDDSGVLDALWTPMVTSLRPGP